MPFNDRLLNAKGRAIDRLPPPPSRFPDDEFRWAWCLLPSGDRDSDKPARLLALIARMPQLGYDVQLSLPLLYETGDIGPRLFATTDYAKQRDWVRLDHTERLAAMHGALTEGCVRRAAEPRAATDIGAMPVSITAQAMKLRGRRRQPLDPGKRPADNKAEAHRRRINQRHDELIAVVDMVCGRVGPHDPARPDAAHPVVSLRTLTRFMQKRAAFRSASERLVLAFVEADTGAPRRQARPTGGTDIAAMRKVLDRFGVEEAVRRTTVFAEAIHAGAAEEFRWLQARAEGLRRIWRSDRSRFTAFAVTFKLPGGYRDLLHPFPCTPNDCALLIRDIAHEAINGLATAAFGVMDAFKAGWPHLHAIVVATAGDAPKLRGRIDEAYRKRGMPRMSGQLYRFDEIVAEDSGQWRYVTAKLDPSRVAGSLAHYEAAEARATELPLLRRKPDRDERAKGRQIVAVTRLAAWHQAHRISKLFHVGLKRLGHAPPLLLVPASSNAWIDHVVAGARAAGCEDPVGTRAELLRAVGFAPALEPGWAPASHRVTKVASTPRLDLVDVVIEMDAHDPLLSGFFADGSRCDPTVAKTARLHGERDGYRVLSTHRAGASGVLRVKLSRRVGIERLFSDVNVLLEDAATGKTETVAAKHAREAAVLSTRLSADDVRALFRSLEEQEERRRSESLKRRSEEERSQGRDPSRASPDEHDIAAA